MYSLVLVAVAGIVAAAPRPQDLPVDAVDAIPSPTLLGPAITASSQDVSYPSSSILSSVQAAITDGSAPATVVDANNKRKRQAASTCQPQPSGYGPIAVPDTVSDFLANAAISASATAAATAAPPSYTNVFVNLQGSTQQTGYLGLHTLHSYDPAVCASYCDSSAFCEAFNLYFERDPTENPNDPSCANPPSTTNIKCTLYGYPISANTATNTGQYRNQFQVVIAGSNGYVKNRTPPVLTNFTGPVSFGDAAINAPNDPVTGANTYIGVKAYDTGRYDPSLCATACQAQTLYDKTHPASGATTYMPCNFFNAYILVKNGIPQGTICSLYTETWDASYATNYGQTRGTDVYTIYESLGYSLTNTDPGTL